MWPPGSPWTRREATTWTAGGGCSSRASRAPRRTWPGCPCAWSSASSGKLGSRWGPPRVHTLGRPGVVASLGVALAGIVHPSLRASEWLPVAPVVVSALALLLGLGIVARARADPGAR